MFSHPTRYTPDSRGADFMGAIRKRASKDALSILCFSSHEMHSRIKNILLRNHTQNTIVCKDKILQCCLLNLH